jgi:hypothetical protein
MAFVGLPIAFLVTSSGLGLLAERVARTRLANGLLAPVGFCVAVSLMLSVFSLGGHVVAAVIVLLAASAAGFAFAGRSTLRAVSLGWSGLAALAVYAVYILPMAGTGGWTWLGYNFLNDTSVQFLLIEHLKSAGTSTAGLPLTTAGQTLGTYLGSGYPLGAHSFAAALSGLLDQPIAVLYQSFLAAMAAVGALGLAAAARAVASARASATIAAFALGSNLTFQYAMQGDIKEIAALATLCAAAGVTVALVRPVSAAREPALGPAPAEGGSTPGPAAAEPGSPLGPAAVLGVCLAGCLSTYSAAGLPYVGAAAATAAVLVVAARGRAAWSRRWLAAGVLAGAVTVIASAAALSTARRFYNVASAVVSVKAPAGPSLGQLAHPLGLLQATGIWLDGNYFEPIRPGTHDQTLTTVAAWLIVALIVWALVTNVARRRPEAFAALLPVAITTAVVAPRVTPYADGKLLAILSPAVVLTAGLGLIGVWRRARPVAVVLGGALALGVGLSDAYAYHDDKPAPQARIAAIADADEHAPGSGPILFTELEEFAKSFDPAGRLDVGSEAITPRPAESLMPVDRFETFFDLDQLTPGYVQSFANIILRRSPAESRPPANFRLSYENRYYAVWTRDPAAPVPSAHLPLSGPSSAGATATCTAVEALVRDARTSGGPTHLVAAELPPTLVFDVAAAHQRAADNRSANWPLNGLTKGDVTVAGPGQVAGTIDVSSAGRYDVWVRGDLPRPIEIAVDGREVGTASGVNTTGQWLAAGSVALAAGRATVRALAGGGSLRPGNGALGLLGPVAFVRRVPEVLLPVPLSAARTLCGRQLDWIEVLPGADA